MMKKGFALFMAGAMMVSRPVMAATNTETAAMVSQAVSVSVAPRILFADVSSDGRSSIETMLASAAMAEDKTVGEYMNNAVTRLPGLENVTPLGQGGHVIINGVPGNQTFSVLKPHYAYVNFAKTLAGGVGGRVLNVAEIKASVPFDTAIVNFYAEGVKAGQNIKVYQYRDEAWVEIEVTEIREDHVVVNMTSLGTLAFIELPAAQ
ncbi:MAG: hypothetical protein HFI58_06185 [Lachnospiraceae bacterium]|jgi:hypothetical protein|nr:hypothetical protein [Lachnospiraceae bacterium]MCI8985484.1 hypothetical protein [Lachnospiraceae bacterium]MCI9012582.1 hypothetical protein [Lachnospiraceae bacterium]MCI9254412.1 hypothetical protein [Lachnospiraceae bacterium]